MQPEQKYHQLTRTAIWKGTLEKLRGLVGSYGVNERMTNVRALDEAITAASVIRARELAQDREQREEAASRACTS